MNPIAWAFCQDVGTAEKLVLVWLASRSNPAGVGLMDRHALEQATNHKPRSIQRLLKKLRDDKLLEDAGDWFVLGLANGDERAPLAGLPAPPAVNGAEPPPALVIEDAAEAAAGIMHEAGQFVIDQLAQFEQRQQQALSQWLATFDSARDSFHVEPPPDPVLEDPRYEQLLAMGIDQEIAYEQIAQLQARQAEPTPASEAADAPIEPEPRQAAGKSYEDTALGRLERVADILVGGEPRDVLEADIVDAWEELEADENRHTVAGEVAAAELLYPAIVAAARRNAGKMTLAEFLDGKAIARCRAPWDKDPTPTVREDRQLEIEISHMLSEIEQAAHPNCQVQPRIVEKGDDGVTRTETIAGYHRRVTQVHRQLQQLKAMGAA